MKKDEILKLHELSYQEAKSKLNQFRVLHGGESLADCAFRLRDEYGLDESVEDLYVSLFELHPDYEFEGEEIEWLLTKAKPIHWIQAALLAAPPQKGE